MLKALINVSLFNHFDAAKLQRCRTLVKTAPASEMVTAR